MSILYINGEYIPAEQAKISVNDRSYLFGEGLFETFRSHQGKVPFLQDHLNRLEWSSLFLHFEFPTDINLTEICQTLLKKNNLEAARLKIVLSREPVAEQKNVFKNNVVVFCDPLPKSTPGVYKLKIVKSYVNNTLPLAAMKLTNYLNKILARTEAQDTGFDDAVMLNQKGMVTETTTGNLFWLDKDGHLRTIIASEGLLPGVTKKNLMALLTKKGLRYKEDVISPEDLSHAREIFLTNSIVGIKPVVAINHRQISGGEIGSVTLQICELWEKHIKELTL